MLAQALSKAALPKPMTGVAAAGVAVVRALMAAVSDASAPATW